MKWWINFVLIILVTVLILPILIVNSNSNILINEKKGSSKSNDSKDFDIEIANEARETIVKVYEHTSKKILELPLEEYLIGVVAAEMPASFEMEALKAQVVAARTLAIQKLREYGGCGCNKCVGADVCSSPQHCQGWITEAQQRKNWGNNYSSNYEKILKAIEETKGNIMTYQGKPIEVFFYSTSNGKTEDAKEVFSMQLPYYSVVESKGEEDAPKYKGEFAYSNKKFIEIFKGRYPKSNLSGSKLLSKQIKIQSYTESGRVKTVTVGGVSIKGTEFRILYGLNSADFTFEFQRDKVIIHTTGYGHGVGMSQIGADRMAKSGYEYEQILKHYYRGVNISSI